MVVVVSCCGCCSIGRLPFPLLAPRRMTRPLDTTGSFGRTRLSRSKVIAGAAVEDERGVEESSNEKVEDFDDGEEKEKEAEANVNGLSAQEGEEGRNAEFVDSPKDEKEGGTCSVTCFFSLPSVSFSFNFLLSFSPSPSSTSSSTRRDLSSGFSLSLSPLFSLGWWSPSADEDNLRDSSPFFSSFFSFSFSSSSPKYTTLTSQSSFSFIVFVPNASLATIVK